MIGIKLTRRHSHARMSEYSAKRCGRKVGFAGSRFLFSAGLATSIINS